MDRAEVAKVLGEPDDLDYGRSVAGVEVWSYTYGQGFGRTLGTVIGVLIVMAPFILLIAAASRSGNTDLGRQLEPLFSSGESSCTVRIHFNPDLGTVSQVVIK